MLPIDQAFYIQASEISTSTMTTLQAIKLSLDRLSELFVIIQLEKDTAGKQTQPVWVMSRVCMLNHHTSGSQTLMSFQVTWGSH